MDRKYLIIILCSILVMFGIGVGLVMFAKSQNEIDDVVQAIPVLHFEHFDKSRNALIIALYNPGSLSIEIDRTGLIYQTNSNISGFTFNFREYGDKPLVLDPGDTILVPLKTRPVSAHAKTEEIWGELEFRISGQKDFYSLHHRFDTVQFNSELRRNTTVTAD